MRIIFMGSPDFALPSLDALIAAGHDVCAVYCQPPRRAGRGKSLSPTPVQVRAQSLDIPVRMPASLRDGAVQAEFAALNADIAVVAAYGLILPQAVLDAPRLGCINVHGSILPRWRGAAPVQRAILAGDSETGVTIMAMEAGLDTGAMRATARTSIADKNAGILTDEIAHLGARLLVEVLANPSAFPSITQPVDGISYAAKIEKAHARLDFTQTAAQVVRQVRAFAPSPGAYFEYGGERFRVLDADVEKKSGIAGQVIDSSLLIACGKDALRPTHIQRAGKSAMSTGDFLRGFAITVGTSLL